MRASDDATVLRAYGYDATGNRTSVGALRLVDISEGTDTPGAPGGGQSWQWQTQNSVYANDSHRLIALAGEPRAYDAGGRVIGIGDPQAPGGARQTFGYDLLGRLRDVQSTPTFAHNGKHERVRRVVQGQTIHSAYDEQGRWLGDYDQQGVARQQIVWLNDLPVALIVNGPQGEQTHFIEADALGSPRALIDATRGAQGVVTWRWPIEHDPFGDLAPEDDVDGDGVPVTFDLRFPGQRFDAATGLNYNYHRDYEPATGRYVQSDPLGLAAGSSTYAYVENGPLDGWDPLGLVRWEGEVIASSLSFVGLGGLYVFDLTSQCVKGRKARVLVQAWGVGLGGDLFPVNSVSEHIVLEDYLQDIAPMKLQGLFGTLGFGVTVGPWSASCRLYELGSEDIVAATVPANHVCHTSGRGFEAGASFAVGHAKLKSVQYSTCDECEPIEAVRW
jgi:RHS repeat-associated protein